MITTCPQVLIGELAEGDGEVSFEQFSVWWEQHGSGGDDDDDADTGPENSSKMKAWIKRRALLGATRVVPAVFPFCFVSAASVARRHITTSGERTQTSPVHLCWSA